MKTVSLEIAKRLKEAGFRQCSSFYYDTKLNKIAWSGDIKLAPADFNYRYIAAPDVSELLEALPERTELFKCEDKGYSAWFDPDGPEDVKKHNYSSLHTDDTPADALALLWLELNGSTKEE
jgi:hypothetical protein